MSPGPPKVAERLLSLVLGSGAEARTILGDLAEDYADVERHRGRVVARIWYWKEAMALSASTLTGRLVDGLRPANDRAPGSRGSAVSGDPLSFGALWQDARYALRSIRRDPGFFAFGAVIVGVGVGASTAVFSVVSPLLLQPLPMESPERLVVVEHTDEGGGFRASRRAPATFGTSGSERAPSTVWPGTTPSRAAAATTWSAPARRSGCPASR